MAKHDRKVRRGIDYDKLGRIWAVLAGAGDWLHVAEIARRTGINEVTVRWYLDRRMAAAIESQRIAPTIKLRLVRLKPGIQLPGFLKAMNLIKVVKEDQKIQTALRGGQE